MKSKFLLPIFLLFFASFLTAQTTEVIADWESTETSYEYITFGNGHFADSAFAAVANPHASGINTSSTVATWWKANDAATWGGLAFTPTNEINFIGSVAQLCIKVRADHACEVLLKVEGSTTDGEDCSLLMSYTTPNEWQELCFDYSVADGQGDIGLGHIYTKIALFMDFGEVPAADAQYWFDDITKTTGGLYVDPDTEMLSDNETGDTTVYSVFGNGHFGDSTFTVVSNPTPNSINSSANVYSWCEANDASSWGGFRYKTDTLDFTGNKASICISVLVDHEATFRIKAFGSETGPDVRIEEDYTTPGEWQQLCFDFTEPGINGNTGQGHLYTTLDFYLDYGSAQADDDCYYFDNILIVSNGTGMVPQLIENLVTDNSELSTFKAYVDAIDLWSELNASGVTVFAPTNAAFDALPTAARDALDNNTDNATFNMVLHHMAHDSLPSDLLTEGLVFYTRNGQDGTVSGGKINGGAITSSGEAINGFLHALDQVMTYPENPAEYMYQDNEVHTFDWSWFGTAGNQQNIFVVDNPAPGGMNTSATVLKHIRFPGSSWWQGLNRPAGFERPFNFTVTQGMTEVCMDVYADHDGTVRYKPTNPITTDWTPRYVIPYTANEWQTVCMDATAQSLDDPHTPGSNEIYAGMALYFDEGDHTSPTDTVVIYFDNFRTRNVLVSTDNIERLENFEMSPNPATDYLDINADTPIKTAVVYDVTGRMMFTTTDPINNNLDVSALQTGMYFIKFVGFKGEIQGAIRFVKQ